MITGSHVHVLKTGADRMPGRFDDKETIPKNSAKAVLSAC